MKNAFIIHGFNGDTTYTFGPYVKEELEERGYNVIMPNFPIRNDATYLGWRSILEEYLNLFNEDTIVICHSIGNPFFIKFLTEHKLKVKLYISVAGFCKFFMVPDREDINKAFVDFMVSKADINYCKSNIKFKYSLYSDNDHIIPFDILENFINQLDSTPVFISGVGHMGNRDNTQKLPQIIDIINKISD